MISLSYVLRVHGLSTIRRVFGEGGEVHGVSRALQMPWQEVGVKLGDADVRMPEHPRELEQVRHGAQKVACVRVPASVGSSRQAGRIDDGGEALVRELREPITVEVGEH